MMPKPRPFEIEYVNGIDTIVRKAGIATSKSVQSIYFTFLNINTPTIINAAAVAAEGTIPAIGARKQESKKSIPVTTDANPVLAPAAIPVLLSTKLVIVLTPVKAPVHVAAASATRALVIVLSIT